MTGTISAEIAPTGFARLRSLAVILRYVIGCFGKARGHFSIHSWEIFSSEQNGKKEENNQFCYSNQVSNLIDNKKVAFNYEIIETLEAGIELFGFEVKALRAKHGSLEGAHVVVRGDEAFLVGAHIPPYQPKNTPPEYDPERTRKLLLTKKEISALAGKPAGGGGKGLTIVPISVYNKARKIKVKIGFVRGKKKFDKRETIKKRDTERDIHRELKDR